MQVCWHPWKTKWIQWQVYSVHTIQWQGFCQPRSTKSETIELKQWWTHTVAISGKLAQKTCCKIAKVIKSSHGLMITDTRDEGRYAATGLHLNPPRVNRPGGWNLTRSRVKPCETWTTPELRCRASCDFYGQLQGDDGTMGPSRVLRGGFLLKRGMSTQSWKNQEGHSTSWWQF